MSLYLVRGVSKVASEVVHTWWSQLLITGEMVKTKKQKKHYRVVLLTSVIVCDLVCFAV